MLGWRILATNWLRVLFVRLVCCDTYCYVLDSISKTRHFRDERFYLAVCSLRRLQLNLHKSVSVDLQLAKHALSDRTRQTMWSFFRPATHSYEFGVLNFPLSHPSSEVTDTPLPICTCLDVKALQMKHRQVGRAKDLHLQLKSHPTPLPDS